LHINLRVILEIDVVALLALAVCIRCQGPSMIYFDYPHVLHRWDSPSGAHRIRGLWASSARRPASRYSRKHHQGPSMFASAHAETGTRSHRPPLLSPTPSHRPTPPLTASPGYTCTTGCFYASSTPASYSLTRLHLHNWLLLCIVHPCLLQPDQITLVQLVASVFFCVRAARKTHHTLSCCLHVALSILVHPSPAHSFLLMPSCP